MSRLTLPLCLGLVTLFLAMPATQAANDRPNFILFIADDVSWNDFGCYGNKAARTPNIDALASNGIRFTNAYLTASSCSPSRASIVTGRYPHNNGKAAELHLPIAGNIPWFPRLLREAGYYTALSGKNHMSSARPKRGQQPQPKAFDLIDNGRGPDNSGGHANWVKVTDQRPKDRPFLFWFAAYDAHRGWDADRQWDAKRYGPMHKPGDVVVPPFLVDDAETRGDLASYYNEVTRFDHYIGKVVDTLRKQGELDNTMILVLADNGRPFPRAKTRIHDSGMKTALVAHWPKGIKHQGATSSLTSVIDFAPTILSAAGVKPSKTMQGVDLAPIFSDLNSSVREFAFSEHNWHDYEAHGRGVRTTDYLLIRNFRTAQAWQGPADSVRSPSHVSLKNRRDTKKLNAAQADVFLAPRPEFELYDIRNDPHQLTNLAGAPKLKTVQASLTETLQTWMKETADSVPSDISQDSFDRETGKSNGNKNYRGTTPGEDKAAHTVNAPGPR